MADRGCGEIQGTKLLKKNAPMTGRLPCPALFWAPKRAALPCPALGGAALAAALPCPDLRAAEEKEQGAALPCPVAPPGDSGVFGRVNG